MILFSFPSSPFGCKVKAVIFACGSQETVTIKEWHPWQPGTEFRKLNPLGKIPVLQTSDQAIFDSPVICEYLMEKTGMLAKLMPNRFKSLKIQALVDGMNDAAISMRYERYFRPLHLQCNDWYDRQHLTLTRGLEYFEDNLEDQLNNLLLFENLCAATMLSYFEIRFADLGFAKTYPKLYHWYDKFIDSHPFLESAKAKDHPIPADILRLQK